MLFTRNQNSLSERRALIRALIYMRVRATERGERERLTEGIERERDITSTRAVERERERRGSKL